MTEKDKKDCLQGVQEYIKQNTNSQDKEALMQAIEKVLQQNYIFDSDVLEVLDYIGVNIWGIYHKGYMDFKGKWHDDYYELELGIWERGSLCCGMIKDAIRLLKKKYTYMQSKAIGGSSSACGASLECVCPADSDIPSVGGISPDDGKEDGKQPQQLGDLENKRKFAEHILIQDKLGLLEELHNLLDNKIGKYVAMTIRAAVEVGVMSRPYFPEVKAEFVEVGNKSGYNAYYNKVEAYDKNDFEYVKEKLLKYKKVEN